MDSAAFGRLIKQEPVIAKDAAFTLVRPGAGKSDRVARDNLRRLVGPASGAVDDQIVSGTDHAGLAEVALFFVKRAGL